MSSSFLAFLAFLGAAAALTVTHHPSGAATIAVGSDNWLETTPPAFAMAAGGWASGADGSLHMTSNTTSTGSDSYGSYTKQEVGWTASDGSKFTTSTYKYGDVPAVAFEQVWVTGVDSFSKPMSNDDVAGAFPALNLTADTAALNVMSYHGAFINDGAKGPSFGAWPGAAVTGLSGSLMVLFSGNGTTSSLVLSSMTNAMGSSFGPGAESNTMGFGPLGSATSIPAGSSFKAIFYAGSGGITNTMKGWGHSLLAMFGKGTDGPSKDFTLQNLGYSTDHGAYYYYNTAEFSSYTDALLAVKAYADKETIPYKHILLDSWWYYKGVGDGVMNWTAMPDIFPPGGDAGMADFTSKAGWPVVGHNRYWSADSNYAKQNGGQWLFSNDPDDKMIVPLEQAFWDYLMSSSKKWGLKVYEQDWLYNELGGVKSLTANITLGRTWLTQMANAASSNDLTIQYCMPYPRHALQSAELPSVTQIRASDDYVPGSTEGEDQWRIGASSILAHSLALAPSKDNFWTSAKEVNGSRSQYTDNSFVRQAAVSTLSTGPVTPGDGIGFSNVPLIMRSCRSDGLILGPNRPATVLDEAIGFRATGSSGPDGEVTVTYSTIGDIRVDTILSAILSAPFSLEPSMLRVDPEVPRKGFSSSSATFWGVSVNATTLSEDTIRVQPFSDSSPLPLDQSMDKDTHQMWHVVPATAYGGFLGELTSKWVPLSGKRFTSLTADDSAKTITAVASGVAGEEIHAWFATVDGDKVMPKEAVCTVPASGTVTITFPAGSCM